MYRAPISLDKQKDMVIIVACASPCPQPLEYEGGQCGRMPTGPCDSAMDWEAHSGIANTAASLLPIAFLETLTISTHSWLLFMILLFMMPRCKIIGVK